jgi:hypothetical protein
MLRYKHATLYTGSCFIAQEPANSGVSLNAYFKYKDLLCAPAAGTKKLLCNGTSKVNLMARQLTF